MLGRVQWRYIVMTGLIEAAVTLAVFVWALTSRDIDEARSLTFATLVLSELLRAFGARSVTRTFWEVGAFTNLRLLGVVVVSGFLQLAIHHIPVTQTFFQIQAMSPADCIAAVAAALCPVTVIELQKLVRRFARRV
jgi:Ca2+-transporting ATPase